MTPALNPLKRIDFESAETFQRAMEGSEFSIVRDPTFTPTLGPDASTFRMVDLFLFAFENDATLLNPLGN